MKNIAVFADRDGVINVEVDNLHKMEDLKLLPKTSEAIHLLNKSKVPLIVITNQAVVARGWFTEEDVKKVHQEIQNRLKVKKTVIDAFYFCPHHPDANLEEYRVICNCRKPNIGMLEAAAKDYNIDIKNSYMIGDSFRDIETGKNAGCLTIAVESGASDFRESNPDYKFKNLYEAVKFILKRESLL